MIRRLILQGWRAFESLDVEFAEGTTFVVAPNGVGKTSLLLGLTWAVFGEHSDIDPEEHIRLGHERAQVTATVIADGTEIVVRRDVTQGRHTSEYAIDGHLVEEHIGEAALADMFGAPPGVASKLAVIRSAGSDPLDVEDHLFRAFGVSALQDAAEVGERLHKEATKVRKQLRTETRQTVGNRDQLQSDANRIRGEVEARNQLRKSFSDRIQALTAAQRVVEQWHEHHEALERHEEQVRSFLQQSPVSAGDLQSLENEIEDRIAHLRDAQSRAETTLDAANAQRLAARSAVELLEGQHPQCPTCARPFDGDEYEQALDAQRRSAAAAVTAADTARRDLDEIRASLEDASTIRAEIQRLSVPPVPPSVPVPDEDPAALLQEAEEELRQHDERTGTLSGELKEIADALADDEAVRRAQEREAAAWHREAMTQVTASSLRAAADRIANEHVVPLSDQVRWRWKALFGDDGLQLRADGTIVRLVGDRELSWEQLSGGERIWARLVAGLLVLTASTDLPFAWIDEPLEHLDPRARRVVAADLASLPTRGGPGQLIVTTYEHAIARQISADIPEVSLLVINRSHVSSTVQNR